MKVSDSKGIEIQNGSIVRVKGSKVLRMIDSTMWGSEDLHLDAQGKIRVVRIDGGSQANSAWVHPENLEAVA
jgi:hypothetical protein